MNISPVGLVMFLFRISVKGTVALQPTVVKALLGSTSVDISRVAGVSCPLVHWALVHRYPPQVLYDN